MAPCCPILNLNGYKINNPTLLARISHEEIETCSRATATRHFCRRFRSDSMHQAMAATMDHCVAESERAAGSAQQETPRARAGP
jgi:xylulose-5-phosphate/fructose-6-phosphate phosphoketolase